MATHLSRTAHPSTEPGGRVIERLRTFFTERIWNVRAADLSPGQALLVRASRVAYATVGGFISNRLTVRAAALTYYSLLSVVPFLAFAFAVLKGFGAYAIFVEGTVRPYLQHTFGENPALLGSIDRILRFVDRTNVSTLGAVGLLVLVYTSIALLASVEDTLNVIWGARTKRSFLRQVTDYVTLLVTTPLLVAAAATAATAAESSQLVRFLREALWLGPVIDFLLRFSSLAVVGVAFFAVYTILPNVRTRPLSTAVGAAVAAVLWQVVLIVYVRLQVGVSGYNAIYSVLSAIPIFLVWTYASWIVVLVGAQVAASHQNERMVRQRFRAQRVDQATKETLAIAVAAHVARAFLDAGPWRGEEALAERLEISPLTLKEILDALVRASVLVRAPLAREVRYVPARELDAIRVSDVRDSLRRDAGSDETRAALERNLPPPLQRLLRSAEQESRQPALDVTLRELAALLAPGESGGGTGVPSVPGRPPGELRDAPVHDAK
jgi:membrane protein